VYTLGTLINVLGWTDGVAFATNFFRGVWALFILFATTYPGTQKMFKTLSY